MRLALARRNAEWKRPAFLSLAFWLATSANAEDTLWCRSLGVDDGLSQNFIAAIAQDHDGFLWFGTLSGLNRWDGYSFVSFFHDRDDPTTLGDSTIQTLHVDSHGHLWVGLNGGLARFDPAANAFRRYENLLTHSADEPQSGIEGVTSDPAGGVWFACFARSRVYRLDPLTGRAAPHLLPGLSNEWIAAIHVDRSDRLWVATQPAEARPGLDNGRTRLLVFDRCSEVTHDVLPPPREPVPLDDVGGKVRTMLEDARGRLWFGRNGGGLLRFDPSTGALGRLTADVSNPAALTHGSVGALALGPSGEVWALTIPRRPPPAESREQLHRVDPESLVASRVSLRLEASRAGDDATVQQLAIDRSGVLWLGSNAGGLRYADVSGGGFALYRRGAAGVPGLDSTYVRAVCKGRDGTLWVGTPEGLNRVDRTPPGSRFTHPSSDGTLALPQPNVQAIHEDRRGHLWIGTAGGLVDWNPASGTLETYRHDPTRPESLADDYIHVIHEDAEGRLWIGTLGQGLDAFDPVTRAFHHHPGDAQDPTALPAGTVHALFSDRRGRLWVGASGGLAFLESPGNSARKFQRIAALAGNVVLSIAESTATPDVLWVGTAQRGLCRLDVPSGTCRFITRRNSALPDDLVYGILPDARGRLWLSTNRGLVRYDPSTETFRTYGVDRGLQSSEFNARAHFLAADGEMFFGGVGGLNSFHPEQISDNPHPPRVLIADVRITDRGAQRPASSSSSIYRFGQPPVRAEIRYRQRDVTFDYVALHYSHPGRNRYEYRLDGYERDWHGPVPDREARYTNLDPGAYTFRVRATSSHGVPSAADATFSFVVLPPFYATTWFRWLLGLSVAFALAGTHRLRVRNLQRRQEELERQVAHRTEELRRALETVETQARKLQELDSAKSKFFANTSHEFRTPLMLTLGPLRDVQGGLDGDLSPTALAKIELAIRNAGRQLELVDQLLMLARLDAGQLEFHPRDLGLDAFLRDAAARYESIARQQQIRFVVDVPQTPVHGRFDESQLEQVTDNLLGNAFKFTPAGGSVSLRLLIDASSSPDDSAVIQVDDTGPGIPEADLPHIFERFYRGEQTAGRVPGAGIGLAVVKECVELHGGEIRAENLPAGGSRFTVRLKVNPPTHP